jgi:acyl carrier protein
MHQQVSTEAIKATIVSQLVTLAGVKPEQMVDGATRLDSLDVDSLATVELLWALEERFGVTLEDTAALPQMTLDELAAHVAAAAAAQAA